VFDWVPGEHSGTTTIFNGKPLPNSSTWTDWSHGHWMAEGSPAGCGWDPVCYFFTGIASAGVNDNPLGIVQSGAAAASPVVVAVGGTAAAAYAPEVIDALVGAQNLLQSAAYGAYTNQTLIEALLEMGSGLNPASVPPSSWWGVGAWGAVETYQNWNTISGWFGH
jgi:hypothetical protein